jgi:hypothetical protein
MLLIIATIICGGFSESLLTRYMNSNLLTELHLDSIFKYGDDTTLPPEVSQVSS